MSDLRRTLILGGASEPTPYFRWILHLPALPSNSAPDLRRNLRSPAWPSDQLPLLHRTLHLPAVPSDLSSSLRRRPDLPFLPSDPASGFRRLPSPPASPWINFRLAPDIAPISSAFQPTFRITSDVVSPTFPSGQLPTRVGAPPSGPFRSACGLRRCSTFRCLSVSFRFASALYRPALLSDRLLARASVSSSSFPFRPTSRFASAVRLPVLS